MSLRQKGRRDPLDPKLRYRGEVSDIRPITQIKRDPALNRDPVDQICRLGNTTATMSWFSDVPVDNRPGAITSAHSQRHGIVDAGVAIHGASWIASVYQVKVAGQPTQLPIIDEVWVAHGYPLASVEVDLLQQFGPHRCLNRFGGADTTLSDLFTRRTYQPLVLPWLVQNPHFTGRPIRRPLTRRSAARASTF